MLRNDRRPRNAASVFRRRRPEWPQDRTEVVPSLRSVHGIGTSDVMGNARDDAACDKAPPRAPKVSAILPAKVPSIAQNISSAALLIGHRPSAPACVISGAPLRRSTPWIAAIAR